MAAAGLTYLQIVNRALVRMRESTVASFNTTEYSALVAGIVNQVKAEIEEAYYWSALRDTFSVTTVNGTTNYTFTGSGPAATIINGYNVTTGGRLCKGTNDSFDQHFFGLGGQTVQTGAPTEYMPAGVDVNYDLTVDVWPQPTTSTNILKFNVYTPQDDLALDADIALVPQNVLIEETIERLKRERGDEDAKQPDPTSPSGNFIRTDLLASAVSREAANDDTETDWEAE